MILVKPSATIIHIDTAALQRIESAGRTCYKSESNITDTSAADFAAMIINRGHESVIEHVSASVRFICDRGVSHEIVRHRLASFSQESTRYCNYKGGVEFVIPPWVDIEPGEYTTAYELPDWGGGYCWGISMLSSEMSYKEMCDHLKWKPEQARSVLPNSLKTEIVMTTNLREWRHFFKLRCANAAHPQMRELAIPLLERFKQQVPVIFDDLGV